MNKIKYFIFAILIGIFLVPNVYAKGVEIESIELVSKSDNTTINSEPTFNGMEMSFDVAFIEKDDYIKYKVVIKNDTDIDYKISDDTSFNKSEYITYKYEVGSELKAGKKTDVFVTITYTKEVSSELIGENKYTETNKAVVKLDNELDNPNTGVVNSALILMVVMIGAIIGLIILNKKYNMQSITMILIVGLLISPVLIYAVETIKLTMNVNVEIAKGYEVAYAIKPPVLFTDNEEKNYIKIPEITECVIVYIGETKYNYCKEILRKDNKLYQEGEQVELKEIKSLMINFELVTDEKSINNSKAKSSFPFTDSVTLNKKLSEKSIEFEVLPEPEPIFPEEVCTLREDGAYNCNSQYVEEITVNKWAYDGTIHENEYGFTALKTDKTVMNFAELEVDKWTEEGFFIVDGPQAFTMPAHNVLFYGVGIKDDLSEGPSDPVLVDPVDLQQEAHSER